MDVSDVDGVVRPADRVPPALPDGPPRRHGGHAASPDGLSSAEAERRLAASGPNVVASARRVGPLYRVLQQLRDPLIVVLLAAAALTIATGDHADAIIIVVVVVVNTVVGVVQEVRADAAVAALGAMTAPTARVIRDGASQVVPAAALVPGDVLELGEGDIVPADARLLEAAAVLVDESALTGESVPVDKSVPVDTSVPAPGNGQRQAHEKESQKEGQKEDETEDDGALLRSGTVVVRGRAVAVVTATGADSAMGRIAALMNTRPVLTPLQRRLVGLGRWIAGLAVALCLVVMVTGLVRGQPVELMVITAVSLVVAAVPESLPAVVTLALALGARRMAARHAVVRRLPAVETLGSVTVVATDKTGTLTEGNMVVEAVWTPTGEALVTGRGYGPDGRVLTDTGPIGLPAPAGRPVRTPQPVPSVQSAVLELLRAAARCNDARLVPPGPDRQPSGWSVLGDPTEGALLAAAAKVGVHRDDLDARQPRVAEFPFDSTRRRMTTVHRAAGPPAGTGTDPLLEVVCKGAPDVVLQPPLVTAAPQLRAAAEQQAAAYAAAGYRVLALAGGRRAGPVTTADDVERDLTLLGLVAIADPPRPAAAQTVADCRRAGITPVLITGDHVATARSIAIRLGLADEGDDIVSGARVDDDAFDPTRVRVFARTSPEQKLQIVRAWQGRGHVVAMTGDGVNDGPALHQADIGVAMGRRGTEVARQAADLVLADDDLATVVAAVEEGRRVYANVRRFLLYGLSGGVAEILVMLLGPAVGLALPLLPAQILWINLVTHGLPGVAFGAEPATPDVMRRPPRPPAQSVLGDGLWQRIARTSVVLAAVTLGVGIWAAQRTDSWQTLVFLTLGISQLAVALGVRARPGSWTNPALLAAVVAALGAQLAAVYLPPLQALLGTAPVGAADLLVVAALALPGYAIARLDRRRADRRHRAEPNPAAGLPGPDDPGPTRRR